MKQVLHLTQIVLSRLVCVFVFYTEWHLVFKKTAFVFVVSIQTTYSINDMNNIQVFMKSLPDRLRYRVRASILNNGVEIFISFMNVKKIKGKF